MKFSVNFILSDGSNKVVRDFASESSPESSSLVEIQAYKFLLASEIAVPCAHQSVDQRRFGLLEERQRLLDPFEFEGRLKMGEDHDLRGEGRAFIGSILDLVGTSHNDD